MGRLRRAYGRHVPHKQRLWAALLLAILAWEAHGQEASPAFEGRYEPPQIVAVLRSADTGTGVPNKVCYAINRGPESRVIRGEKLNVYRLVPPVPGTERPIRICIGTMTILEAQTGVSLGQFRAGASIHRAVVNPESVVRGDIVLPRLVIDSEVLFDSGKSDLKAGAALELERVPTFVRWYSPSKLVIEGHTDSDGDEDSNQWLSEARANVVRDYLINTYSFITPTMIEARGYGEHQPITPNDTPENKALNRRIEIVVWE